MSDPRPFVPSSALTVCIDFRSPQGWLAVHPTFALEDALGIAGDWLPVLVRPMAPPREATPEDDRGTRHRAMRAAYYEQDLQRYANARGLPLGIASRTDDSRLAALGLLWAKRAGHGATRAYIEAVYRAYFTDGTPIALADAHAIEACIAQAGIATEGFTDYAGTRASTGILASQAPGHAEFGALQAALTAAGLLHSPAYLVDGDVFQGRAHLPMLRWLLEGQQGQPPI